RYGRDELDGEEVLGEGDFFSPIADLRRTWERWAISLSGKGIFRGKSEILSADGELGTEPERSRGNEWRAALDAHYELTRATRLRAGLDGLYMEENGYPESSPFRVGSRYKITATGGVSHLFTPALEGSFDLGGFYLHAAEARLAPAVEDGTYLGLIARVLLTAKF
ncbi:MAG: hypothetical protein IH608_08215, partial [Proteobacteria bacterium]|nr:hypothetical protein [Pseudomonadota bacterium]